MKKAISILLTMALLFSLAAPVLADEPPEDVEDGTQQQEETEETGGSGEDPVDPEPHTHSGGTATCEARAVCAVCGESYGDKAAHSYDGDWGHNDSSHWHVCSVCGAKGPTSSHSWDEDNTCACGAARVVEAVQYSISASAGTGGSISPSGRVKVAEGEDAAFRITPDESYEIDALTIDGKAAETANTYTFRNVTADHRIKVTFRRTTAERVIPTFGSKVGSVSVSVSNNTYRSGDFTGTLVSGTYELGSQDTMMTCVLRALAMGGYSWWGTGSSDKGGYGITYLAGVYKDTNGNGTHDAGEPSLAEFDGSSGSGWMGTLNDWFINQGFNTAKVGGKAPYRLESGDVLDIVFTMNLGADVGGSSKDGTTKLQSLSVSGGTLSPSFSGGTTEYTLTISGASANVKVKASAANKSFLVKTFLNQYNQDTALCKLGQSITVKPGDVIYVGCGDKSWPGMSEQRVEGTKYTLKVAGAATLSAEAKAVADQIDALPELTYNNYAAQTAKVQAARKAYDALTAAQKKELAEDWLDKLTKAEETAAYWKKTDDARSMLKELPTVSESTRAGDSLLKQLREAAAAFNALDKTQRGKIPAEETDRYEALRKKLLEADPDLKLDGLTGITPGAQEPQPPVTQPAASPEFTDVPSTAYYYDAVHWAVEKGVTNGATPTTFSPNASCTRAQTVTFLWRAAGMPEPTGTTNPFADVKPTDYYYKAVLWALESGITSGVTANTFGSNAAVKRGQVVTFLWRAAGSADPVGNAEFTDVASDAYYSGAVRWAVGKGVTNGTTATTFGPDANCTRGQIVTFLYRAQK